MPDLPDGKATFQVLGATPVASDLIPIQALHDLYHRELARLKTAHAEHEQNRIKREAYEKAHPAQAKDITLNYWRLEKSPAQAKPAAAR